MFIYVWILAIFYLTMNGYIRDVYLCLNAEDVLSIMDAKTSVLVVVRNFCAHTVLFHLLFISNILKSRSRA